MKKIILIAGICMASLSGINAQQTAAKSAPTFSQKVDEMLTKLTSACNLTPDQAAKIKPIIAETIKARMANKQQYGSNMAQLQAANKATMQTEKAKINAILNSDQQAKLVAYENSRKAEMQKKKAAEEDQE